MIARTKRRKRVVLSDDEDESVEDQIEINREYENRRKSSAPVLIEEKGEEKVPQLNENQKQQNSFDDFEDSEDNDYPTRKLRKKNKKHKVLYSDSEEEELKKKEEGQCQHKDHLEKGNSTSNHSNSSLQLCRGENLEEGLLMDGQKEEDANSVSLRRNRHRLHKGGRRKVDYLKLYEESLEEEEAILQEYEQRVLEEDENDYDWLVDEEEDEDDQINGGTAMDINSDEEADRQLSYNSQKTDVSDSKEEKIKQMLMDKNKTKNYVKSKGITSSSKRASKLVFFSLEIFAWDTFIFLTEELKWGYSFKNEMGDNILMFILRIFPSILLEAEEGNEEEGIVTRNKGGTYDVVSRRIRYYNIIDLIVEVYSVNIEIVHKNNENQNILHVAARYVPDIYILQALFNAVENHLEVKQKRGKRSKISNQKEANINQFYNFMCHRDVENVTPLFLACEYGNDYFVSIALRWEIGPSFSFSSSAYLRPLLEKEETNIKRSPKKERHAFQVKNVQEKLKILRDKTDYLLIRSGIPLKRNVLHVLSNRIDNVECVSGNIESIKTSKKKFSAFEPADYNSHASSLASHRKPSSGMNCLMVGIFSKTTTLVKEIVNACSRIILETTDNDGFTCLHYIAEIGLDPDILIPIISDKCPVLLNRQDHLGRTPLHIASASGQTETISTLLKHGAKPSIVDKQGWPPLLYSDFSGNRTCTTVLLQTDTESQVLSLGKLLVNLGETGTKKSTKLENLIKSMITTPQYSFMLNTIVRGRPELLCSSFSFLLNEPKLLDTTNKKEYMIFYFHQVHTVVTGSQGSMGLLNHHTIHMREGTSQKENMWIQFKKFCSPSKRSQDKKRSNVQGGSIDPTRDVPDESTLIKLASPNTLFQYKEGMGIGQGVDREILCVFASIITDSEIGFLSKDMDGTTYLPKVPSTSDMNNEYKNKALLDDYRVLGLLLGHILKTKRHLPVPFHPLFLNLICNESVSYHCLFDLDEELARSLQWIMEQQPNNFHDPVGDLELSFTWNDGNQDIPLIENGENIKVTMLNREDYVNLVTERKIECYKKYAVIVRQNILSLWSFGLSGENHKKDLLRLLRMFQGSEMAVLINGAFDVDIDNLKDNSVWEEMKEMDNTLDLPSSPSLNLKEWFWDYLGNLSRDDKALLLKFVTGSTAVPINGFQFLNPRFKVQVVPYSASEALPRAATCFNTMKLPIYPEKDLLEKNIMIAIRFGSEGFSFL